MNSKVIQNLVERGTDPNGLPAIADSCAALIVKLAGGYLSSQPTDVYPRPIATQKLTLRPARTCAIAWTRGRCRRSWRCG